MAKIIGPYDHRAQAHHMLQLLGVKRLPAGGMTERTIQGVRVYVKPAAMDPGHKRHRVMAICECGRHVPAGRLGQHKCKSVECTNSPACARGGCADCERSYGPQR